MLNQTDISYNVKGHNKFYVIQLLESDDKTQYYCWQRWGRVGADGQNALKGPTSLTVAMAEFKNKYVVCFPVDITYTHTHTHTQI